MSGDESIKQEAADLLACLASQPDPWQWFANPMTLPGQWSFPAVIEAQAVMRMIPLNASDDWRETYAEAEARMREAVRHG